jgi:hypothetical protein
MHLRLKPNIKTIARILILMVAMPPSNMATNNLSDNDPTVSAQIESQIGDEAITFTGLATNYGEQEYLCTYKMVAKRNGQAGHSINQQSGSVLLKPGNTTQLSKTTISATTEDSYKVTLLILFNESVIASDSMLYSPD